MNKPIISTPVGARGYDIVCRDGIDYMLAKNDEEFINKTLTLLSSPSKAKEMAKRGYEIGCKNYSQRQFCEIVKKAIIEQ